LHPTGLAGACAPGYNGKANVEGKPGSKAMLSQIEIKGFKSIRDATLDLRALNLLIGANGAGKSNLMAVFGLLNWEKNVLGGRPQR
jgi:ABC-type uncharacterized transport system ATPase subunit